jgi:hypothetical protein
MRWKINDPRTYLNLIGIIILLVGLGTAALIYRTAEHDSNTGALGYEIIGGQAYPIMPEDSKVYLGNLQRYGGKELVLIDEVNRWFGGLWHGKSLAFTVTFLTIVIFFAVLFIANHLPSNLEGTKGE